MLFPKVDSQWLKLPGIYGEFLAPDSKIKVGYVLTYASLDDNGTGNSMLTQHLVPVREFYDVGELSFDEILQRDIDDHRVAIEIIPYLLKQGPRARFFPPILAVIAPSEHGRSANVYPQRQEKRKQENTTLHISNQYGNCFKLTNYYESDQRLPFAELSFNPERSKIIVIDGQHRAMAMLAIKRSKTGNWGDKGRDYKFFYEDLAADLKNRDILSQLKCVELPVCICFFPDLTDESISNFGDVNKICRKIFLDVNKQARKPSKSRTLLLDDSNLLSGLTRGILQTIKDDKSGRSNVGINIFEYDSVGDAPVPKRELALCSVEMLYQLVYWSCFGKDEYYSTITAKQTGRLPDPNKERFIREICLDDLVSSEQFEKWGYRNFNKEFTVDDVPASAMILLSDIYCGSWGAVIKKIFSDLHPFSAHNRAVYHLKEAHKVESGHANLAYKALFEGQGILWTIEKYSERRKEERKNNPLLPDSQIENAYKTAENWIENEFNKTRARFYWDLKKEDPTDAQIQHVKESFKIFRTQAFTVGVLVAFAYLKQKAKIKHDDFLEAVDQWIGAWNKSFLGSETRRARSLRCFDRTDVDGMFHKHFGSLKPTDWYWFRYFTFEIMMSSGEDFPGRLEIKQDLVNNRSHYIKNLAASIVKAKGKIGEKISNDEGDQISFKLWREALKHSLNISYTSFDTDSKITKAGPDVYELDEDIFPVNGNLDSFSENVLV